MRLISHVAFFGFVYLSIERAGFLFFLFLSILNRISKCNHKQIVFQTTAPDSNTVRVKHVGLGLRVAGYPGPSRLPPHSAPLRACPMRGFPLVRPRCPFLLLPPSSFLSLSLSTFSAQYFHHHCSTLWFCFIIRSLLPSVPKISTVRTIVSIV